MVAQEISRLVRLAREHHDDELLTQALAGRERNVENLVRLFAFITTNIGLESDCANKYWTVISGVLEESGVTPQQLKKSRYPFPRPGEPGFRSILDEMREEEHDI